MIHGRNHRDTQIEPLAHSVPRYRIGLKLDENAVKCRALRHRLRLLHLLHKCCISGPFYAKSLRIADATSNPQVAGSIPAGRSWSFVLTVRLSRQAKASPDRNRRANPRDKGPTIGGVCRRSDRAIDNRFVLGPIVFQVGADRSFPVDLAVMTAANANGPIQCADHCLSHRFG